MARARNIKPGFFTNDELGELPALARLLFAGLWTLCDRQGRVEDRPKKIKAEVLPYDDCDADALLSMLHESGFILRYTVAGTRLIQVVKWEKHQTPHMKEAASALPAPDEHCVSTVQAPYGVLPSPAPAHLIPDSLNRIPDSLHSEANASDAAAASAPVDNSKAKSPEDMAKSELWKAAVSVLEAGGCPSAQCRTFMGKLVSDYGFPIVKDAVASASGAQPADAREYLKATCQRLKGERKDAPPPVTVPSAAADQTAAYLAEQARHAAAAKTSTIPEHLRRPNPKRDSP